MMSVKNFKIILFSLFCVFASGNDAFGQKKTWVKFGDQSMKVHDAYSASKFYSKALAIDSSDLTIQYKLAKAFMAYQNFPKALPLCLAIEKQREKGTYREIEYQLGKIHKYLGDLKLAQAYFEKFVKAGNKSSPYYSWAKNELDQLPQVKQLFADTAAAQVRHLKGNVNTGAAEFSPVLLNDSVLLFSSLRAVSISEDGTVPPGDYNARIYTAERVDTTWLVKKEVSVKGSKEKSVANGSFGKEQATFYFSVCEQFGDCQIHQGKWSKDSVFELIKLPVSINAEGATATHPQFIEKGGSKYLLFASNRPGGRGGMDLWVSEYKGTWKTPKNLGKTINTPGNELTPFYRTDSNELFFSSDWHYNMGGLDIFKSTGSFPSSFTSPVNLGIPFNSPLNDLYYTVDHDENGFLTSSRAGSITEKDAPCCNDIYEFEKLKPLDRAPVAVKTFATLYQFPAVVYFHNDRPNVDSWDTTTTLNYETTYSRYLPLYKEYRREFSAQFKAEKAQQAQEDIDAFFEQKLKKGHRDLLLFSDRLIQELDSGRSVELLLRGFASPLTKTDYNVNLSKRRINSVLNFLKAYKQGELLKYFRGTASNEAVLTVLRNPNGEYKAKEGVSDDYYDVRNSIYNPNAALERKVELSARVITQNNIPILGLNAPLSEIMVSAEGVDQNTLKIAIHNNTQSEQALQSLVFQEGEKNWINPILLEPGAMTIVEIPLLFQRGGFTLVTNKMTHSCIIKLL